MRPSPTATVRERAGHKDVIGPDRRVVFKSPRRRSKNNVGEGFFAREFENFYFKKPGKEKKVSFLARESLKIFVFRTLHVLRHSSVAEIKSES